jgi:hypothetical protein
MKLNINPMSYGHREKQPYLSDYEKKVARLEEEITDIKGTLAGNQSCKRYTLMLIELESLEGELRATREKRINNAPLRDNPAVAVHQEWRRQQDRNRG